MAQTADILPKLFGNKSIVKMMRLFLLNADEAFETSEVRIRTKTTPSALRSDMNRLRSIGFIKKKTTVKVRTAKTKKGKGTKKKVEAWQLNIDFPYLSALKLLLLSDHMINKAEAVKRMRRAGKIKLIVLSGIFLRETDGDRVDVLVVGDKLNRNSLETALRALESEVGKELSYAIMDSDEFNYRLGMYDKFIRDILDYPHEKLVNKIGV